MRLLSRECLLSMICDVFFFFHSSPVVGGGLLLALLSYWFIYHSLVYSLICFDQSNRCDDVIFFRCWSNKRFSRACWWEAHQMEFTNGARARVAVLVLLHIRSGASLDFYLLHVECIGWFGAWLLSPLPRTYLCCAVIFWFSPSVCMICDLYDIHDDR